MADKYGVITAFDGYAEEVKWYPTLVQAVNNAYSGDKIVQLLEEV
jgi:hypothetical protein